MFRHMPDPRPLPDDEAIEYPRRCAPPRGQRTPDPEADLFLATVAAECLYERLALAGIVLLPAPEE